MIETLGDVEVYDTPNYNNSGNFMVGTGTGDRAVSTIGNNLMGDRNYLKPFATEGSYVNISDIENGVYEFDVNQLGRIDSNNNDALYAWNGKQLTLIADNENGLITNSVDVIYGELSFIAVDVNTKTGTTDFTITDLERTGDLSYSPPTPISLMPDNYLGDVDFYDQQTRINNGSGDRAVSTLSSELDIDLSMYGTEGSYASWEGLENGIYEITYSLYASENDFNHDNIYFYDGSNLNLFDSRSSATIQSSATRWISETITQQVAVTDGKLTFITLDTVDKSGTTQLRINGIEKVATPINETIDYISGAGEYNDNQFKLTIELGDNANNPIQSFTMDFDGSNPILDNTTISQSNVVTMEISDYSTNSITVDLGQDFTGDEIEIIFDNVDTSKINVSDDKTVDLSFVSGTNGQNVTTIENEFLAELDPALDGNINSYFLSEPPFPIPANNKDLGNDPLTGLNLGTLKPWETDSNSGTEYNQGYVYGSYHLGASYITETIGGDDVSDWVQFNLDESSYLNFYHDNAIAQILDENEQVIIGSDDGYSGNLQAYLDPGNYYIGFSSEASESELFTASIYLSNSDPNYAD